MTIYDEVVVDSMVSFLEANYDAAVAEVNAEHVDFVLEDILEIYPHYVDPADCEVYPSIAIWVVDVEESVRTRALSEDELLLRVMFHVSGSNVQKKMYRYIEAFCHIVRHNHTLGNLVGDAKVIRKKYYTPFYFDGANQGIENGVCETFLIIKSEVQRL